MWRAAPLLKMVLRMVGFGILANLVSHTLHILLLGYGELFVAAIPDSAFNIALGGMIDGLATGLPMVIVTMLLYRKFQRTKLYRFAMLIVATIVMIELFPDFYLKEFSYVMQEPWLAASLFVHLAKWAAIACAVNYVAGMYIRDSARRLKKQGETVPIRRN